MLTDGRKPRIHDTWIAATALVNETEVWTQDADFSDFAQAVLSCTSDRTLKLVTGCLASRAPRTTAVRGSRRSPRGSPAKKERRPKPLVEPAGMCSVVGRSRGPNQTLAQPMQSRVRRPNLDGLLEDLMEPVARQARRRAAEAIREAS